MLSTTSMIRPVGAADEAFGLHTGPEVVQGCEKGFGFGHGVEFQVDDGVGESPTRSSACA